MTSRSNLPSLRSATFAAALLLAALPAAAFAAESPRREFDRSFQKTLPLATGRKLTIEHSNGDITIETGREPQVSIDASIHVSSSDEEGASRFAAEIEVEVRESAGGISIRTRYPERKWNFTGRGFVSYAVNYRIRMPEGAELEAVNHFGNVSLTGLKAPASVRNSNGAVTFREGKGKHRLENSFGSIEISGNAGEMTVVNSNGSVKVTDVEGPLEVRDRFGRVTVSKVGKRCLVHNSNGEVTVSDVSGSVEVTNSFGAVDVSNVAEAAVVNTNGRVTARTVRGAARLETQFGAIDASGIGGDATVAGGNSPITLMDVGGSADVRGSFGAIHVARVKKGVKVVCGNSSVDISDIGGAGYVKTSFGLAEAARVAGDLTVENTNGAVRAAAIKGGANVRTSFASVSLDGVEGPVEVDNQNGSIEVRLLPGSAGKPCGRVALKSSFGGIRLFLPENAGYAVNARTSFGKIRSELLVTASGTLSESSLAGQGSLAGKIGDGRCPLDITDNNGSIDLLKGR